MFTRRLCVSAVKLARRFEVEDLASEWVSQPTSNLMTRSGDTGSSASWGAAPWCCVPCRGSEHRAAGGDQDHPAVRVRHSGGTRAPPGPALPRSALGGNPLHPGIVTVYDVRSETAGLYRHGVVNGPTWRTCFPRESQSSRPRAANTQGSRRGARLRHRKASCTAISSRPTSAHRAGAVKIRLRHRQDRQVEQFTRPARSWGRPTTCRRSRCRERRWMADGSVLARRDRLRDAHRRASLCGEQLSTTVYKIVHEEPPRWSG